MSYHILTIPSSINIFTWLARVFVPYTLYHVSRLALKYWWRAKTEKNHD